MPTHRSGAECTRRRQPWLMVPRKMVWAGRRRLSRWCVLAAGAVPEVAAAGAAAPTAVAPEAASAALAGALACLGVSGRPLGRGDTEGATSDGGGATVKSICGKGACGAALLGKTGTAIAGATLDRDACVAAGAGICGAVIVTAWATCGGLLHCATRSVRFPLLATNVTDPAPPPPWDAAGPSPMPGNIATCAANAAARNPVNSSSVFMAGPPPDQRP